MKTHYKDLISKPEIQFWIPIIIYAISFTTAFMSLKMELEQIKQLAQANNNLLEQKLSVYTTRTDNLVQAVNKIAVHQCTMDTMHNIACYGN
jgi:hypothetical protein